ncbi:hypothetical protein ACIBG8_22170 [Nonomuraea sp. NPDC050556]|uniref:hypothetical protein n=1 Tax=Nonomuraea sp. NPDC050556 TaxID=3364369 RepID=UPI0037BA0C38
MPSAPSWIDDYALLGRLPGDIRADVHLARDAGGAVVETDLGADALTLPRVPAASLAQALAVGRWAGRGCTG